MGPQISESNSATSIGAKILLSPDLTVWRGMLMLEGDDSKVKVLGGKVEAWDKAWRETRIRRLKEEIQSLKASESGEGDETHIDNHTDTITGAGRGRGGSRGRGRGRS